MSDVAISHSNYERNENDLYRTEPWVTKALLDAYKLPDGNVWEPACGYGDMVEEVEKYRNVVATDINVEGTGYGDFEFDFIKDDRHEILIRKHVISSIITNPPFGKQADLFARKIVELVGAGTVYVGALLLRTEFSSARGRADLFADCNVFDCEIRLTKRPRWDDWWNGQPPKASPRHNYSWYVWNHPTRFNPPTIRWAGS